MLSRSLTAALVLVALLAGSATAASSMSGGIPAKVGNQVLRWREPNAIRIAVSTSVTQLNGNIKFDSDVVSAINKSLEAWQDAADVEFTWESTDRTNVSPAGAAGDGVSLITIAATPENALLFNTKDSIDEAARTRLFYNAKGFITEADIVLNPYQQFSTDGTFGTFDLQSTLTHEIGHLLGLRHSGVMGSTMSPHFSKNGLFGLPGLGGRTLDESDIAAVRELYSAADDDLCCAAISGKILPAAVRGAKALNVWAENSETGRVTGLAEVAADGTFTLAGMPTATYNVYWQRVDETNGATIGSLGTYTVENAENKVLPESKMLGRRPMHAISYIGMNAQLADSAVDLAHGQEYTLFVAGEDLDPAAITIVSSASSIVVDRESVTRQDFGDGVSAVSFRVAIGADTKPGTYSLFVGRSDGARSALVGALKVE